MLIEELGAGILHSFGGQEEQCALRLKKRSSFFFLKHRLPLSIFTTLEHIGCGNDGRASLNILLRNKPG
jgi:hypothetical protein